MNINAHIRQLDYPEYAGLSSGGSGVDLAQHKGRMNRYDYVFGQDEALMRRIAEYEGLKKANILITAGADSGLHHVAETFLGKGKVALIPAPSFGRYEFHAKVVDATVVLVKHSKFPCSLNLEHITSVAHKKSADIIFFANPNNPTGELINKITLNRFIKNNSDGMIIVDEALVENSRDSIKELVNEYKNLIIIKSFSKQLGLPGLRVGYMLANPQVLKEIRKTVSPYEVSSISMDIVKKKLVKNHYCTGMMKKQREARHMLKHTCPLPLSNTEASVALIDGGSGVSLCKYLHEHGILTVDGRNFRGLEETNTVRVIINNKENIIKLVAVLNQYKMSKNR